MNNQPTTTRPSLGEIFGSPSSSSGRPSLDEIFSGKDKISGLNKQDINDRKDMDSASTNGSIFPAETGEGPLKAGLKATGNVPSSAFNLGKNVVQAAIHPIRTVEGLGDTAGGAIRAGIEKATGKNLPGHDSESAQKMDDTFHTVANSLKDRYGSLENLQRTATNDPVGFGSDVLSLITGGAGLAKDIPGVSKIASTASDIAKPMTNIPSAVNDVARGKVADVLKGSAQKDITKVLAPTKEVDKQITQQVAPELAKRNIIAFSRKGLSSKVADQLEMSGHDIDEAWQALPADSKEPVKPIIDALENSKSKFMVDGVVVEPTAWKAADDLQKTILDVAKDNPEISSESLRRVRQIWDESIARNKGFNKDLSDQDKLTVKKEATGAIRKVLADSHPNIAKLNAEYTLWSKVDDVLSNTIKRKTGQDRPLGEKVLAAGGIGGGAASAGLKGAVIGASTVAAITLATKSTLWRTLSATTKNKLADAIVARNPVEIKRILIPIVGDQIFREVNNATDDSE